MRALASRRKGRRWHSGPAGKQRDKQRLGGFSTLLPDVIVFKRPHAGIAHSPVHTLRTALHMRTKMKVTD